MMTVQIFEKNQLELAILTLLYGEAEKFSTKVITFRFYQKKLKNPGQKTRCWRLLTQENFLNLANIRKLWKISKNWSTKYPNLPFFRKIAKTAIFDTSYKFF